MLRTLSLRLTAILTAVWLAVTPSFAHAQKALVYCPVGVDATGCNAIVAALTADATLFPGGVDAGYDGTNGTVDLATADLPGYAALLIPSLADGQGLTPYALLRNTTIAARIQTAFMGRTAVWSGTPDRGTTNRAAKDELIRNLARWAKADSAGTHGPGLVVLQDNSDDVGGRYGWMGGISALAVAPDTTLDVYSNVQVLTTTGQAILTGSSGLQIGYTNMASYGVVRTGGTASADDATGGRTTRVVLVTMAGEPSDPNIATVRTDREDYSPGDTVTVTGAGWTPGETVSLLIHEDTLPLIHPDLTYSAVADGSGLILNREFVADSGDLGIRFTLTATGLTSGKTAQATFTDAPRIAAVVTVGAQSGSPVYGTAGSATYTVTPTRSANGTVNGTFSVTSGLPAGVTAGFSPATFSVNGNNAFPSSTLTLTVSASALPGTYTFNVRVADGADQGNGTGTLVIATKTITGSLTAANKVYDGTTAATILTRTLTGVVGADVVSLTGGTATFATKTVGNGKTVTATGLSLTGADASKYTLASTTVTTTANITAATLTGSFTASNRTYDGTTAATIATRTLTGVQGTDVVSLAGGTATFANKDVGLAKTVTGTGFSLSGADAGNYVLASTTLTTTADITAKPLTPSITAANKVYDATTAATILTRSLTGVVGAEVVTLTGGTATFADKNVGNGKTVTASGFTLAGADAGNYALNPTTTTTANITPATVTGQFTASNKEYDGTTAATIATRSVTGTLGSDVVTLTGGTATFADKHVGTGKTVTGTGFTLGGADGGNYVLASTTLTTTADITAATVTGHFTVANKVYDATTDATILTRTLTGIVGSDVVSLTGGTATFDTKGVGTGKTVTGTGFTLGGADAGDYVLASTTITTTADITVATLTGHITADNKVYDGTTAATLATRTLTGVLGTDAVTLTGGTATFATKNVGTGKTVTATGLTLSGADAGNYILASTTLTATADITARTLTVTATGHNKVYDATTAATVTRGDDRISGDVLTVTFAGATFADKNVGNAKTVTVTGVSISGADAGNYTLASTTVTTSADITPATLTGHFTASDKVYDGTTGATIATRSVTGVLLTDDVDLAGGSATFANKNVGTNKTVTGTGFTLSGTDAGNYVLGSTTLTTTAGITVRTLTATATGINKVYDATTAATVTLGDDRVSGDDVTLSYTTALFANKNVGNGKPVSVSGIAISGGTDAGNYALGNTTASTTADITPATLVPHITASNKVYDGTTAATIATRNVTGVLLTDDVSLTSGTATFANKNAATGKTVTGSGFTLSGTDAGNYVLNPTSATATADITARTLTATATGHNKVYDASTTATVTLGDDRVAGDDVTLSYTGAIFANKNVGNGKTISVSGISISGGADAGNYQLGNTTASATADITAASLTPHITAGNKVYDGTTDATILTRTLSGVLGSDVVSLDGGTATFADKSVGNGKTVTGSGFTLSGGDAGNYVLSPTTATTTADITQRDLTLTATGINKVYDFTTAATVTLHDDRVAGDVFTASYTSANFTDKDVGTGKTVNVSGMAIAGADAGNYHLTSTTAATTANITAATVTGHFTAGSKVYDGTTAATIATRTLSGVLGTDIVSLTGGTASFADKNVGAGKTVTGTGFSLTGADIGNYVLASSTLTATASITARDLAVGATGVNKVYDGTAAATVTPSDDRVAGDVFTVSYAASFSDKNVGTGKTVSVSGIAISGTDAGNYHQTNTTASTTADITQRDLAVTATGQNKVYDGSAAAVATLQDNRVLGDVFTASHSSASFNNKNVGAGKPVNVSGIAISGTDAPNYHLTNTIASTTANITARSLAVTATGVNKNYDGNTTATVTLSDNRLAGDLLSLSYAGASFADPSVGANKTVTVLGINVTGLDAGNYSWNTSTTTTASILAWTLAGYYQPVDMPAGGMVWNTVKGGSTVPLKFQIFVGSTERTDIGAVKAFTATATSCGTPGTEDTVEVTTTGGTELRYTGGQFIQNWQTPKSAGACYRTTMTAQDGSLLTAYFKLK